VPAFRSHNVLEIVRGIKASLKLDVGLVRGKVPNMEQQSTEPGVTNKSRREKASPIPQPKREQSQELEQARELLLEKDQQLKQLRKQLKIYKQSENKPQELSYEAIYEARIQATSADVAIGGGSRPFDTIGRLELGVLTREGLKPTDTLVDLGCGTGRLAVQAIPTLSGGRYIGIDISQTMLDEAQKRVEEIIPGPPCQVSWIHQTTPVFELDANSVDMVCAFSVINHMEHEDAYLYLKEALRVVRPGGRFVFSCLPINTKRAREVFLKSTEADLQTRHRRIRHVATSKDFMTEIARLAGWTPIRWYDGDEKNIQLPDDGELYEFNQSICVLEAPRESGSDGAGGPAP
jgi:SAM-dependent methyltransferase